MILQSEFMIKPKKITILKYHFLREPNDKLRINFLN